MKKEVVVQAKTTELAVSQGAKELNTEVSNVTYEVIEEAKKGFLGMGAMPCKVKVCYEVKPEELALGFIKTLVSNMEITADINMTNTDDGEKKIDINGEAAGILIGHHGDTLDALQYLANLAANKRADENDETKYARIIVDVENYRNKREAALRTLAQRMAEKVKKYKRSITLEPMTPQERRIIHSEIQNIAGVATNSIGQENNRRIVVHLEKSEREPKPVYDKKADNQ